MKNIFSYTKTELENELVQDGYKKFMASQIFDWLYQKKIYDVNLFSNININNRNHGTSKPLRFFAHLKV